MPSEAGKKNTALFRGKTSVLRRIAFLAFAWLIFISGTHYWLNGEREHRRVVRMGYMPVVTNLACPLLDFASRKTDGVLFDAVKFSSFAEMGEALRNGDIHVAFIIAPLAIVLRQQGEDVKVVYIGNRHESALVAARDLDVEKFADLEGETVAVPMRFSGHNLCMLELIERYGMRGRIKIVEMNPPDMASALSAGALSAYCVGEPFAAQTVRSGESDVVFRMEEVWPGFICNLMLVKSDFIDRDTEIVETLVNGAVRSGLWAERNPAEAAEIVSAYWNQERDLVEYALTNPGHRIVYDLYIPKEEELRYMAGLMKRFGLSESDDISGLIEDRFARKASLENIDDVADILKKRRRQSTTIPR